MILALSLLTLGMQAQTVERRWNVGLIGGITEYQGDLGNKFLAFDRNTTDKTFTYGLTLNRYLNRSFDFGVLGSYGIWGYFEPDRPNFQATMFNFNGTVKYKFYNGYMLKENSLFMPYILAGIGVASFKGSQTSEGVDAPLIAGAGVDVRLGEVIGVGYQARYGYLLNSDSRDLLEQGNSNDAFLIHTVGLSFNLGQRADEDDDGVSDRNDQCANTPANVNVNRSGCPVDTDKDGVADYQDACPTVSGTASGCPDRDKDGVADRDDQCVDVAGSVALKGCPDADGDGIIDSQDQCPTEKGALTLAGCPDKDGDGIKDSDDKCPDVSGVKMFDGCPDSDGDEIADAVDACPNAKGPRSTDGCPDTDQDGVHDGIDNCPTTAGLASNNGCPELKREVQALFNRALQGIKFGTGKSNILPTSYPILDAVAKVMAENPSYKLLISGHTDNIGSEAANQTLSTNRAEAVGAYLIKKGVSPMRVAATGYGMLKPVDDNKSAAGRTRNRRVELKVEYLKTVTEVGTR